MAVGISFRGWLLIQQGQFEEGIAQMRRSHDIARAIGVELYMPARLAGQAEGLGKAGQVEEGLSTLAEALAIVEKTGEHIWEAELYRLKGELLLKAEGGGMNAEREMSPEDCFLKAIDIARAQQAKSLELRATISLSRLWHSQGSAENQEEARQMLAEIYGWFTEGFDTLDLKEAKALLEELG